MRVSVVVPVYDSPDPGRLVARLEEVFAGRPEELEIVLVDDGSPDPRVWPELERLAATHPGTRAIQLTRNFGQQAATLCGLAAARGDVVVTMDDDLQQDPADIPRLLAAADHDIVIGQLRRSRHAGWRRIGSRLKGVLDWLLIGKPRHIHLTSFRLLRRPVVNGVLGIRTSRPFLPALMFHVSRDVVGVEVDHAPRAAGRTGYTPRKLLRLFFDLVVHNSPLVLRLVAGVGIVAALGSIGLAVDVVARTLLHGRAVLGWASLMSAVLLLGGLLLLAVGVVGEYLIRIAAASEGVAPWVVRREAGSLPGTAARSHPPAARPGR